MTRVPDLGAAALWRVLFPGRCRVCGVPTPRVPKGRDAPGAGWSAPWACQACAAGLAPREGGFCPRCGAMEGDPASPPALCAACLVGERPFSALAFHAPYGGVLRDMIVAYKFGRQPEHGLALRDILLSAFERARAGGNAGDAVAPATPDVVVPVPLHPARLAWRGFNQSLELARPLARRHGWPVDGKALARIRDTKPQSTLSGPVRRENIRGAFAADASRVRGRNVLLIDDVMTTGATVEAAAQALLAAGARRVDAAVLAR